MRGQKGSRRAQVPKSSLGHSLHYMTAGKIKLFREEQQKLFLVFFFSPQYYFNQFGRRNEVHKASITNLFFYG